PECEIIQVITFFQRFIAFAHDPFHLVEIVIAQQDIFRKGSVYQARMIDQVGSVEDRVGYVDRLAVPTQYQGGSPADLLYRPGHLFTRQDDVLADPEDTAGINRHAAKQVGDQSLSRKTYGDSRSAAESQQAGRRDAQLLQNRDQREHHNNRPGQFAGGVDRGLINIFIAAGGTGRVIVVCSIYEAQKKPGHHQNDYDTRGGKKYTIDPRRNILWQ